MILFPCLAVFLVVATHGLTRNSQVVILHSGHNEEGIPVSRMVISDIPEERIDSPLMKIHPITFSAPEVVTAPPLSSEIVSTPDPDVTALLTEAVNSLADVDTTGQSIASDFGYDALKGDLIVGSAYAAFGSATILYDLSSLDGCAEALVATALGTIESATCLQFEEVAAVTQQPHIQFVTDNSTASSVCTASLGPSVGGNAVVSIGWGCRSIGAVVHLTLHALGMPHESSRVDASSYLTNSDQVPINVTKWWDSVSRSQFDFGSVLLPQSATPQAMYNASSVIGQMTSLSVTDAKKLSHLYGCRVESIDFDAFRGSSIVPPQIVVIGQYSPHMCYSAAVKQVTGQVPLSDTETSAADITSTGDWFARNAYWRLVIIIVGSCCGLGIMVGLSLWLLYRRRKTRESSQSEGDDALAGVTNALLGDDSDEEVEDEGGSPIDAPTSALTSDMP